MKNICFNYPTKYNEAHKIIDEILYFSENTFLNNFIGMYLTGSLIDNSFNEEESDIDFIIIIKDIKIFDYIKLISDFNDLLIEKKYKFSDRIEGQFILLKIVNELQLGKDNIPSINEGKFYLGTIEANLIIHCYLIQKYNSIIKGISPKKIFKLINKFELKKAIIDLLNNWWSFVIETNYRMKDKKYLKYTILTMCRMIYTLFEGDIISKKNVLEWALNIIDERWKKIIKNVIIFNNFNDKIIEEIKEFVKYTINLSNNLLDNKKNMV